LFNQTQYHPAAQSRRYEPSLSLGAAVLYISGSYTIWTWCGTTGAGGGEGEAGDDGGGAGLGKVGVPELHAPHTAIASTKGTPSPLRWRPRINLISI
jgi:hypothetical protein